jgi:acetyl esterase
VRSTVFGRAQGTVQNDVKGYNRIFVDAVSGISMRRIRTSKLHAFGVAALLVTDAFAQSHYPPEFKDAEEHTYKVANGVKLNLYVFKPERKSNAPHPAIVFFFGGGWANGSPAQFEHHCRYLASRGMVAIAADYRVASRHGVKAVDCVRDAKSAIRWVRQHAAELGVDPERIVAAGGSAGGHLAACTAVLKEFDEPDEDPSISSKPAALVLFNPALSFTARVDAAAKKRMAGFAKRLGVEPARLSPADHVDGDTPPTLVLIGTEDFLRGGVEQFAANMEHANQRCEVKWYEGREHGFFNARRSREDSRATIEEMDRFLASLGYLKGEPTVEAFFSEAALP